MDLNKQLKIWLAPMEGVVDPVIRKLYSQIGGYDFMVTEFVRVTDKINPDKTFKKYCPEINNNSLTDFGTPVFVQLLGGQTIPMSENAQALVQLGVRGIDINFGCPAKTVNRHDGGAALLKDPTRVYDVTKAIRSVVPHNIPVSAKVRLGFEDKSLSHEIAMAASEADASWLTIHARTKIEGYRPPAHWHYIAKMKEVSTIPVIANGDIWTTEDYEKCYAITNCPSVALGRGAIADPYLALKIKNPNFELTKLQQWEEIKNKWLPLFIQESIQFKSEHFALVRTKQWLKLLGRTHPQALELFESIKRFKELTAAQSFLNINLLSSFESNNFKPNHSSISSNVL
ncbi:MAG: tRNA-dihydrouridine synthase family protein [Bdellovibrionales bacterium]|nr:tRNA-dihydrouridine synthase family protein [Bdellovibrionales bacterium]